MEVCRNSLKLFMIVLLNQHYQHLELNKYFFQSLTVTMIIIKREILSNKIIQDIKKIVVVNIKKKVIVIEKMV